MTRAGIAGPRGSGSARARPPSLVTLVLAAVLVGACGDPGTDAEPGAGSTAAPGSTDALGAPTGADPATPTAAPLARRDVVLIVIDTLRADRLGCYGYERDTSPNIDALAARGVRFTRATAQSSWTGPSMVSMFLGRHVGADFVRMPAAPTLAERLRAAGYATAGFQDNILLEPGTGFERGFDVYEMEAGPKTILPALSPDPRPRFLYFHFVDPHDPYDPIDEFDLFDAEPVDAGTRARFVEHAEEVAARGGERPDVEAALAHVAEERAAYDGDVRQADQRVGFVVRALEAARRLDDALIVLAADHGESLWQHPEATAALEPDARDDPLRRFKRTHNTVLYESLVHVPLIVAGPGVPEGLVVDAPVENIDILPTVLELVGLAADGEIDGTSLVPLMEAARAGRQSPGRALSFANTELFTSVLTHDGRKLIVPWDEHGPDAIEWFDLRADPHERTPLPLGDEARALLDEITAFRERALVPAAGEGEIDDDVLERLQQLGYVGER